MPMVNKTIIIDYSTPPRSERLRDNYTGRERASYLNADARVHTCDNDNTIFDFK